MFYVSAREYKFSMPDGNEIGANDFWEPGGYTSGGKREAAIEGVGDAEAVIRHDDDIGNLASVRAFHM